MLDEFEELICFAAVVENGSITAAAKALKRSKAHISRKISELETRIGAKLLYRSTRKLVTTDAGDRLKSEALQLYKNGQLLSLRASGLDDRPRGKFVITASYSVMTYLIGPHVKELQESFPDVNFKFLPSNLPLDLVAEGIDMGIRTGSVVDDRLIGHQVGIAYDQFFYCPATYEIEKPIVEVSELLHHRLLVNTYSLLGDGIKLTNGEQTLNLTPQKMTTVSEQPFLINLVLEGCGIGLASDYRIKELEELGQAKPVLSEWRAKQWPVFIVYPFLAPLPTKLAKISTFFRQRLTTRLATTK
jgi:DNA-binding transcriptional LysR family regulator